MKLEAQSHVVREQHIEINIPEEAIDYDGVDIVKVVILTPFSRPKVVHLSVTPPTAYKQPREY